MNAEQLFLHIIGSDETLTGEQRQQMHVMMLRLSVYPHLEKMLEKQSLAAAGAVQKRCHELGGTMTPYQAYWAARHAEVTV
jgi:hypothetical protein